MEGPWGKPGPGGTVWRNPRDIGQNFSKSMVKQSKTIQFGSHETFSFNV